ncbi:hypothetical protein ZPAH1_orf00195 [Aeromonas phage ZPAH1]|nr:hypothetical protein ASwh1_146 [Aeromonas phage Aswh_1]QQG33957.1 hypothetical protein ZPAH1_orf00195 [Aeromonas phage ZPAH1]
MMVDITKEEFEELAYADGVESKTSYDADGHIMSFYKDGSLVCQYEQYDGVVVYSKVE